jgi:hypothetical protein
MLKIEVATIFHRLEDRCPFGGPGQPCGWMDNGILGMHDPVDQPHAPQRNVRRSASEVIQFPNADAYFIPSVGSA